LKVLRVLLFFLEVSRPGLWFQTLWLYLLPLANRDFSLDAAFWLGAIYVLFPLNLLVYGWNDMVDAPIDAINPRKGNFLFGARATPEQLRALPPVLAMVQLPFWALFILCGGAKMALLLAAMLLVLALYNAPKGGWRGRPPLELGNQLGYLLLIPLSMQLNGAPNLPLASWFYLTLFCTHAHLMGEIMDVGPDRAAGRRTTATVIGALPTKFIVMMLVFIEGALLVWGFRDVVLGGFLLAGVGWLLFDVFYWGNRTYTRREFLLFGLGLNAGGFASMAWVSWTGTLTQWPG